MPGEHVGLTFADEEGYDGTRIRLTDFVVPSGVQVGDFLIGVAVNSGSTGGQVPTQWGAGWTNGGSGTLAGSDINMGGAYRWMWKVATATEISGISPMPGYWDPAISIPGSRIYGAIHAWRLPPSTVDVYRSSSGSITTGNQTVDMTSDGSGAGAFDEDFETYSVTFWFLGETDSGDDAFTDTGVTGGDIERGSLLKNRGLEPTNSTWSVYVTDKRLPAPPVVAYSRNKLFTLNGVDAGPQVAGDFLTLTAHITDQEAEEPGPMFGPERRKLRVEELPYQITSDMYDESLIPPGEIVPIRGV